LNLKDITHTITTASISQAQSEGKLPKDVELPPCRVEYPKEEKFGDTSTSIALESAKVLRRSPLETGGIIKEYAEKYPEIEKVEIVKPGFINFTFSFSALAGALPDILVKGKDYGKSVKEKPERINIEFVSANPTGPLNIVSARAAAIGDTIASLLEAGGDSVEREYYINDYGNQVMLLGRSVLARIKELEGEKSDFPEDGYHGEYIKDIAAYLRDNFKDEYSSIEPEDELLDYIARKAVEYNVNGQKKDLEGFNVDFTTWFSERSLHEEGKVEMALEFLEGKKAIYLSEGKKIFQSTEFGDDKDRVVIRDDGRPTYLLADIAYHREKASREYDKIINIWGPDHHGYVARLSGAMELMGYDNSRFKVLIAQQVNLVQEGETVKMSKRLGNFSTMKDLLEEIGTDVARYFFIMRSLESHLDFDLVLAKKDSSENPVFYLQYAHARICSIFRESLKKGYSYTPSSFKMEYLDNPESVKLMKMMVKFPEEVSSSAESMEPHRLSTYLMRLAQLYHKFYTEHRILSDDHERSNTFMFLSDCVRTVLRNGLNLLGVSAPEQM
jgi:arginyl-tRNA synthetase